MKKLRSHLFVCTHERPVDHPKGSCGTKSSDDLVRAFKSAILEAGIHVEVRAQKAGCLDACEWGPAVVVYPQGVWYAKVQPSDIDEIVTQHLVKGLPVTRLLMPGK